MLPLYQDKFGPVVKIIYVYAVVDSDNVGSW